jgi:hypothetical protein
MSINLVRQLDMAATSTYTIHVFSSERVGVSSISVLFMSH